MAVEPLTYGATEAYGNLPYKGEPVTPPTNKVADETGKCLHLSLRDFQGEGWSQYNGAGWSWPDPFSDVITIIDSNEHQRHIVFDEVAGYPVEISTIDGPALSNLVRENVDKRFDDTGTAIASEIQLPEHKYEPEKYTIELQETNLQFRPLDRILGYLSGLEIDIDIFRNGELTRAAFSKNVKLFHPINQPETSEEPLARVSGDIHLDREIEGERLRYRIVTNKSGWRLVKVNAQYIVRDREAARNIRKSTEDTQQENISNPPRVWFSRGPRPHINRFNGIVVAGHDFDRITGPDFKNKSAMDFTGAGKGLEFVYPAAIAADMTIIFSMNGVLDADVLNHEIGPEAGSGWDLLPTMGYGSPIGGSHFLATNGMGGPITGPIPGAGNYEPQIEIAESGGNFTLIYRDTLNELTFNLTWDGTGWQTIQVVRKGTSVFIYENGKSTIASQVLTGGVVSYSGLGQIMDGQTGKIFDFRIYNKEITLLEFLYYYTDLVENNADAICPIW